MSKDIDMWRSQSQKELTEIFNTFNAEFKEAFKKELQDVESRKCTKGMLIGLE